MKKPYYLIIAIFFMVFICHGAMAQQATVSGVITDESNGEPIAGVNVIEKNSTNGTITNINGEFTLELANTPVTLIISFIGYSTQEYEVSQSESNISIVMKEDITSLEEVVVTGLASSVKRSNLANSVASVSGKDLAGITTQPNMENGLYGKFTGANIVANSGAPGGGYSLQLRGLTSINGSNEPLYIVDGVFIDNSAISAGLNVVSAAAGGGSQSNQDNPSNRIADLDPEDIESIEILKGASAAAIYGSRASGGVVIITTKKGKEGKTNVTLSQSFGQTTMLNPLGTRTWDATKVETHFGAGEVPNFQAAESSGTLRDYENELYGNKGFLATSRISVSGGNAKTNFFAGFTKKDDEGIVKNTGYEKTSFRLNMGHQVTDWLEIGMNANYINSSSDRGFFNNDNSGTTMGVAFVATPAWAQLLPDSEGNYPNNPYAASNFLQTRDLVTNNETINRFIGGINAKARVFTRDNQSLDVIARVGVDYYNLATTALFPNTLQFQKDGNGLNGVSVQGNTVNRNTNYELFVVHNFFPGSSGTSFRTQLGVVGQQFFRNTILGTASNLNGSQTNLDQSGSRDIVQNRILQEDFGFFIQEEVNFNDKIIATLGIRGDKSSNNGDANQLFYYPKASVAVNIHEMDFWSSSFLSQFKVRAAFGQAGNYAVFGDKFTSLDGVIIEGLPAVQINRQRGNSILEPERQSELEFGTDLGLLNNRINLDITYYIKTVEDLLLTADVPTSSGFARQVTNAADMENKGLEIGLNMNLLENTAIQWISTTNFWFNQSEVTRLDIPSYTTGGFADFLGQYRIKQGHSPTEIIGVGPADLQDEDGLVVFGDAQPDFQMSFLNTIYFLDFEFSMLWHWKQGGENINLTALLSDLSGTSPDYDKIDLDPEGQLGNGDYRLNALGSDSGPYIENAGYVRMREIGLYYNIPSSLFNEVMNLKVGFSGYNLINFFEYRSYDPEVSNFGGKGLSTGVDVTPFPSSKRYNFHIIARF